MKLKNYLFVVLAAFLFMGCGGGDADGNGDGPSRSIVIAADNASLLPENKALVQMTFSSPDEDPDVKIVLSDFSLAVAGCSVSNVVFLPDTLTLLSGTAATALADITFSATCSSLQSIAVNYTKVTSSLSSSSTMTETETVTVGTGATGGTFFLSPHELSIFNNNQVETVQIVTLSDKGNPVSTPVTLTSLVDGSGKDYGNFDTYNVVTDAKGEATVTYTAPSDINKVSGITKAVTFERADDNATNTLTIVFSPRESNQGTLYTVDIEQPNKVTVNDTGTFIVNFVQADDNQSFLSAIQILDVNVTTMTPNKVLLIDENGYQVTTINYSHANKKTITAKAGTLAGTAYLKIDAKIFDGAKITNISLAEGITVSSGAVHNMSINYASSEYKDGIFYENYTIHAVDQFNNPPDAGIAIYAGVVGGLTNTYDTEAYKLYLAKNVDIENVANSIKMTRTISNSITFKHVELSDTVVFLANSNGSDPDFLGGWGISSVGLYELNLDGIYYGEDYDELTAVVGDATRLDLKCAQAPYTVDLDAADGVYTTDENGLATLQLKYDPYFVAKDVYLYAQSYLKNDNGEDKRVGTAAREKLRGGGFEVDKDTFTCETNTTCN